MAPIINSKLSVLHKSFDCHRMNNSKSLKQAFQNLSRTLCLSPIVGNLQTRRAQRRFRTLVNLFKLMRQNHRGWLQVLATYQYFWTARTPCKPIRTITTEQIPLLAFQNPLNFFRSQASTRKCLTLMTLGLSNSNSNHNWKFHVILCSHRTFELKIW
jgi:hypothetical protein